MYIYTYIYIYIYIYKSLPARSASPVRLGPVYMYAMYGHPSLKHFTHPKRTKQGLTVCSRFAL